MTKDEEAETRSLVTRLFDAVSCGDMNAVADCYADDAVLWHSFDGVEKTKAQVVENLAAMHVRIADKSYEDRRLNVFERGFVQQHVLHGTRVGDGMRLTIPTAIICQVKNGKITRFDEYLDSKAVAELRKAF
ncbi:nuclear transport factor 2 family protein [Cupriavidus pauculus]|uniref:nuclear transport factor 2 family protein n=1 Tax=Cupriavidus pauculus TaxID=82633 RepID=UPI000785B72D|nr:nuclear transport factor 2 family protein [Cupriavidus pauculus]